MEKNKKAPAPRPTDKLRVVPVLRQINKFSLAAIDRREWVKYRTVTNALGKTIENILTAQPSEVFAETVDKYVNAYLFDDKMPPAEIATAITNIADDVMSNREPVVRAGDYIAIQNFIRGK